MSAPRLADRVMKARRESLCPVCLRPIRVGDMIARAGMWQHIQHVIDRQRKDHPMTPDEAHAHALAGMLAAIEYARVQHAGMSGAAALDGVQTALDGIRADCERGQLDLAGALASITLRAATLACQASEAAGKPLTIGEFLDEVQAELTPPGDLSGL